MQEKNRDENVILKGAFQNGWLGLRPDWELKKLVKSVDQEWCKDFKLGSHRLKGSWMDRRFERFDPETGVPECPIVHQEEHEEQSYSVEPGQKRSLKVWIEMHSEGFLTDEDLKELQEEPWFEQAVSDFRGLDGLEEYKDFLKTPAQQRIERGIDPKLTTQRRDKQKADQRKRRRAMEKQHMRPVQQGEQDLMRKLNEQGYSVEAIQSQLLPPSVGKRKSSKSALAKKWQKSKKDKEIQEAAKKAKAEEKKAAELNVEAAYRNAKLLFRVIV